MNLLKKLNYLFYQVSKKTGAFMLLVLIVTVTMGIISRYLFNNPFTWVEELATFLFVWISFLGATTATYEKRHVAVDFLVSKLPGSVNGMIKIIVYLFILAFMVMIVAGSFILFPTMQHVSVALRIPRYCYYISITLSSVMMFSIYLAELIEYLTMTKKGVSEA
ncbi:MULTISPECIES: TRAP transporter small permease [Anaerotruncus]|jgi:TRAP-type C4-dicarboxylate transport system permease small subunit|uniref:TRAP transporter small permease n=1 Tax=Anaerotruncus TaxID=244127 RepID=UPI0008372686|nr:MULTISPECIES: TRAP transporter small permease [Anaerotruncus]RGX56264.1 TRAP transporter small permease [Anaerotruncus sp. AF02-27]